MQQNITCDYLTGISNPIIISSWVVDISQLTECLRYLYKQKSGDVNVGDLAGYSAEPIQH